MPTLSVGLLTQNEQSGWEGETEAQPVHGKSAVAARFVEENFSTCSENDGQIGIDMLLEAVLFLCLHSALNRGVILFAWGS